MGSDFGPKSGASRRGATRHLAWAAFVLVAFIFIAEFVLSWLNRDLVSHASWSGGGVLATLMFVAVLSTFPIGGLLIAVRRPENRVGWMMTLVGLFWGLANSTAYADYGLLVHPGSVPGAAIVGSIASSMWIPAIGLIGLLIMIFPDGLLPSIKWRWLVGISVVGMTVGVLSIIFTPGPMIEGSYPNTVNPLGISGWGPVLDVARLAALVVPFTLVAAAVALVERYRRANQLERLQLKWLATAAGFVAALYSIALVLSLLVAPVQESPPSWLLTLQSLALLSFFLIPASVGIAVLRHRLYDIDVVIRRTLVFGALLAFLVGLYVAGVNLIGVVLRAVSGESSTLAVSLTTLAAAAVFSPLRRGIQRTVDRRFFRSRYDAERTLAEFGSQLGRQADLTTIEHAVVGAVTDTMHPSYVGISLRSAPNV